LYSKLTEIIPRSQEDIVVSGYEPVNVQNIEKDNNLFVQNNIIYANGATIDIYDVMGRLVTSGNNTVNVASLNQSVVIVKTTYSDNTQFITKLINK
jgi:hypothetical protein